MYLQGLIATFVLPIIHFVCVLVCVTIFSQFLLGITVVPRQIEAQAYAKFGGGQTRCIMGNAKVVNGYLMLILNRTAKEHEWSDPRKW